MSDPFLTAIIDFASRILPGSAGTHTPSKTAYEGLLNEWRGFLIGATDTVVDDARLRAWKTVLEDANALTDANARKLHILKQVKQDRMFGIFVLTMAIPDRVANGSKRWWTMFFAEQLANGDIELPRLDASGQKEIWKVKELSAPSASKKYLILSDIHRDSVTDIAGSVDHFTANKGLYLKVLNYAQQNNYTVIEGGDCEELWFIGDGYPETNGQFDPAKKMKATTEHNSEVYGKLAELHAAGRYVRIQGNHDSYLKDPGVFEELRKKIAPGEIPDVPGTPGTPVNATAGMFRKYDACVIEGVKTMTEHSAFDLVLDGFDILTGSDEDAKNEKGDEIAKTLLKGKLGLTARDYTATTRMIVCHGHQFDFWNNPDNELLGLVISNTAGVPVDEAMDPLVDVGGIALGGNPFIDFGSMFASLPIFNSWIGKGASAQFAHDIQHQSNSSRVLSDNIMFSETLPALWGAVGLFLKGKDENGTPKTPAQSRSDLGLDTLTALVSFDPSKVKTYFSRHAYNHICLGHTHAPHSQPYLTIDSLGTVIPPLKPITSAIAGVVPNAIMPSLKTGYFNSGTSGWMEGVIWAIDIDGTGQARLAYWMDDCGDPKPHYMDWELTPAGTGTPTAAQVEAAVEQFIGGGFDAANKSASEIYDKLLERIENLTGKADLLKDWMKESASLPIDVIGAGLMAIPNSLIKKVRSYSLEELKKDASEGVEKASEVIGEEFEEQIDKLRDFTLDALFSVKRRGIFGFDGNETERIEITVPYASGSSGSAVESVIDRLTEVFKPSLPTISGGKPKGSAALHLAAFAYGAFGDFPNNMPFFEVMDEIRDPAVRARKTATPVLQAFLSTLWMYPLSGDPIDLGKVRIETAISMGKGKFVLTVQLSQNSSAALVG